MTHLPRGPENIPGAAPVVIVDEEDPPPVAYGEELEGTGEPAWAGAAGFGLKDGAGKEGGPPTWGDRYPASVEGLGEEIADFVEYASPDADELRSRFAAMRRLDSVAKSLWPGSEAEPFGSTKHRMLLHGSDLDVRIRTVGKFENIPECHGINQLGAEVMKQPWAVDMDPKVTGRVPQISYVDSISKLRCKVCVGNRQTVRGTSFFNSPMIPLSARFPAFKVLMLPVKTVFKQRGLEKSFAGGVGTFRIGMMLLNYLAMHAPASTRPPTPDVLGGALIGFFRYYASAPADGSEWQRWTEPFAFAGDLYVMGVQVDFSGCAMGEVWTVFATCAKSLESCPVGVPCGTSALSRVVKESIVVGAREETRSAARRVENQLPPETKMPGYLAPERRSYGAPVAAAAVPTLHGNGGSRNAASSSDEAPTRCLTLKNMFDPAQIGDGGDDAWWVDIGEEVREECAKHGAVTHLAVDRHSQGFVFVKFATPEAAAGARSTLHARWFGGRLVTCEFTAEDEYDVKHGVR